MSSRFARGRYALKRSPPVCKSKERIPPPPGPPPGPPFPAAFLYLSWEVNDPSNSPPVNEGVTDQQLDLFGGTAIWFAQLLPPGYTVCFSVVAPDGSFTGSTNLSKGDHTWTSNNPPLPIVGSPYDSGVVLLDVGLGDVVGWIRIRT